MSIICRTCLQNVDRSSFFYIDTFDNSQIPNTIPKDVLQLCVPEMDLYISEQPGICSDCLIMFENFYNFKNKCLVSEDKILMYLKKNKINPQHKINLSYVIDDTLVTPNALNKMEEDICSETPKSEENKLLLFSCTECSFVTMDNQQLQSHKCLSIADKFKCVYCEYSTKRRYRLNYHINAKHTKAIWYDCKQCEYKTTDSGCLKRHQKVVHIVHDGSTKVFSCELCEFKTISEVSFQRHKAKHAPAIQVCSICNYQTGDKSNFRKHSFVHGDKPRKCTKCSYQCVSPYQLEKHYKRSHV